MDQSARIKNAIETGNIRKIIVIDDAFDAPVVRDEDAGPLMDFLGDESNAKLRKKASLADEQVQAALEALGNSEYEDPAVRLVVEALYTKFVDKFDEKFDPAGRFASSKGSNLSFVRPLLKLLSSCAGVNIVRVGSNVAPNPQIAADAQVILLDYYLSPEVNQQSELEGAGSQAARQASISMLKHVLQGAPGVGPSVLLMSSHAVKAKMSEFREQITDDRGPIFASRFQFMSKDHVTESDTGEILIETEAVHALLDVAQRHQFAGAVQDALTQWRKGVEVGIDEIWKKVTELELKDFAYLSRFRLADEGQPLSSYLEWFLGEILVDAIARAVDWKAPSWDVLNDSGKKSAGAQIEGAFDGQTGKVADLYFRARVDARPERQGTDMRMGDIYRGASADEILAVITPDCDLVARDSGPAASRLTTVTGKLLPLAAPDSSVSDFMKVDGKDFNVAWKTKDIRTIEFGTVKKEDGPKLLGTLRPLYAYELQGRTLNELGRVGLAVAPAMAVNATAIVRLRNEKGWEVLNMPTDGAVCCAVIPSRGGTDKPRVIFQRSFAEGLIAALSALPAELAAAHQIPLANVIHPKRHGEVIAKLCREGQADGSSAFGMITTLREPPPDAWCQLIVKYHKAEK